MSAGENGRRRFTARFVRMRTSRGLYGPSRKALFENIRLKSSGVVVAKHLWFSLGRRMASVLAEQKPGTLVEFVASVEGCRIKGDPGLTPIDTRLALERPKEIRVVKEQSFREWGDELGRLYEKRVEPGR